MAQYSKAETDAILKAATDLEVDLRTTIKPPFTYMVCAGFAANFLHPQVEVWTDRTGCNADNRFTLIPNKFEGQDVYVYCQNEVNLQ